MLVRSGARTLDLPHSSPALLYVIYQTRETLFHKDIQTPRREIKYDTQRSIFDKILVVWMADEALSRLFDIS